MLRPNCFACVHHRPIYGDAALVECKPPVLFPYTLDVFFEYAKTGAVSVPFKVQAGSAPARDNSTWPLRFDPATIAECEGYTPCPSQTITCQRS